MKKFVLFIPILAILVLACNTQPKPESQAATPAFDTAGLATFQEWKLMNERANLAKFEVPAEPEAPVYKTQAPAKKAVRRTTPRKSVPKTSTPTNTESGQSDNGSVVNTGNGSEGNTGGAGETTEEKKGISNTVKGTVIGAAGGAVLGAVIHKKNRVLGGVIGGVIGGGVGYGIGKKMDKKQAEKDQAEN